MTAHTHAPSSALDDAIAALAIGALDASERPALDAQLAACAACREQLADLERAVAGIGLALDGEAPPADLRTKVIANATGARVIERASDARAITMPGRAPRSSALTWLALAASITVVAGASWYLMSSRGDAGKRRDVMSAPDVVAVSLQAQPDAPGSSARVYMSPKRGMVLLAEHLPALAAGKTYQLWVVTKQAPVSVGVFTVSADGSASGVMPLTAEATLNPVAVAVTIEPEGGVPAPTGPRVLVGMLSPQ